MKNKRGLSAVVATLIIILLVLVAVGILWAVIVNVIEGGAEQIELNRRCTDISFSNVAVIEGGETGGEYNVTFARTFSGEEIKGIKLVFVREGESSGKIDFNESMGPLDQKTKTIDSSQGENEQTIVGANEMVYSPFFEDDAGNELLCPETTFEDIVPYTG